MSEHRKTGAELSAILSTIKLNDPTDPQNSNGIPSELWACMPDEASGKAWVGFMVSVAEDIADILSDEDEYTFDDLSENAMEYADNNTPAYYKDQFEMVSELGLWAIDEVESQAVDYAGGTEQTMREQLGTYCAVAYQVVWMAVCNFIMAGEGEE
jgi:hypothetical protein